MGSRLAGVEVHPPQRCLGSAEVEALVGPYRPPPGRCGPGDPVALVGLAGGVSLGIGVVEL